MVCIFTLKSLARSLAAAFCAAMRCSSSTIFFLLQKISISSLVTLVTSTGFFGPGLFVALFLWGGGSGVTGVFNWFEVFDGFESLHLAIVGCCCFSTSCKVFFILIWGIGFGMFCFALLCYGYLSGFINLVSKPSSQILPIWARPTASRTFLITQGRLGLQENATKLSK